MRLFKRKCKLSVLRTITVPPAESAETKQIVVCLRKVNHSFLFLRDTTNF